MGSDAEWPARSSAGFQRRGDPDMPDDEGSVRHGPFDKLRTGLRQATGFVESLLQLIGLDWKVPDFSTLCRRQKTLVVDIASRRSSEPLHLLIDSTGIKVEGEGEWHARKHRVSSRRVWRKIHLAIDERTLEVCAVEVTSSNVGDAPMPP